MSFETRQDALLHWVPEKSVTLYDFTDTVVYLHEGRLVILRVFAVGSGLTYRKWHVSVDVDKPIDDLKELST